MESESEEIKEVYARFGLVLYFAQLLEYSLVTLVVASRLSHEHRLTRNDVEALMARESRKTLGILIRDLKGHLIVPNTLAKDLYRAIDIRNRLVHRYFRERAVEIVTSEGRAQMLSELDESRQLLEDVNQTLEEITLEVMGKYGITEQAIAAEMDRLMDVA